MGSPLPFKYKEIVDDVSPSTRAYGYGRTQATMTIEIDEADEEAAARHILGHPTVINAGFNAYRLSRTLPWPHPKLHWLHASEISPAKGIRHKQKVTPRFDPIASYKRVRLTVLFTSLPYRIIADGDLNPGPGLGEYDRYVEWRSNPSVEFLNRDGATYYYVDHNRITGVGPLLGLPIRAVAGTFNKRVTKIDRVATWHQVPWSFTHVTPQNIGHVTMTLGGLRPVLGDLHPAILDCLGTVNRFKFPSTVNGYTSGTMMLAGIRVTPEMAPVAPIFIGDYEASIGIPRVVTIDYLFNYFNPPNRYANPALSNFYEGAWAGHNLLPSPPIDLFDATLLQDQNWVLATRTGLDDPRQTLYQYTSFAPLFYPFD